MTDNEIPDIQKECTKGEVLIIDGNYYVVPTSGIYKINHNGIQLVKKKPRLTFNGLIKKYIGYLFMNKPNEKWTRNDTETAVFFSTWIILGLLYGILKK